MFSFFIFFSPVFSAIEEPVHHVIYSNNDFGSKYFRIPAICTAQDGTLVTATDQRFYNSGDLPQAIDVLIRRSKDHALSWEAPITIAGGDTTTFGYGDPSLVVDKKTGAIICVFNGGPGIHSSTPEVPTRQYYCISFDHGASWSDPEEITAFFYGINCTDTFRRENWKFCFISAGKGVCSESGRIMFVGVVKYIDGSGYYDYLLYTNDLGKTWKVSKEYACHTGDESKVEQLVNGSILMSIRNGGGYRYFAISNDDGDTWEPYYTRYDLRDPYCNGEILRFTSIKNGDDKNRLLHTNLDSQNGRQNLTVKMSYDEGETWPIVKVIKSGSSIYSTATIDTDGAIMLYWENSEGDDIQMTVTRLTVEWLTDGQDTYTPPAKRNKNVNYSGKN
ncbi:secreted sialidase [Tritrichomonas foetus]|uniref:Secreted sialidase n=1 Tax=Tritrichomonas foetus TaxID=1144522 RepID=A0A1J4KTG4_9EUKA|nr:secreted sialidase [Tritrichomonas foetus]|eukprot:OHT14547.1 secreted sialidase [Tritrichomonas foetus]